MCYKSPGPRCSRHTREHLVKMQASFDAIAATHDDESIEYLTAKALLSSAKSAWRSSPEGIKHLEEAVANAPEDMDKKEKAILAKTLNRAVAKRQIHKNALEELETGRLQNLASLIASEDTRFDQDEIQSILQAHTYTFTTKELNASKANFEATDEQVEEFYAALDKKFANGTPEQKAALAAFKESGIPNASALQAYASYEEGLLKAEGSLSMEEARIGSFHNIPKDEAKAYYNAYREQYKNEYAHLPESERPDPPKNWTGDEIRRLSPNTLSEYKYLPRDPASVYADYRLRADANSVQGTKQDEAVYASIDLETAGPTGSAGFRPSNGHIIEVGIVKYNNKGEEISRYAALARPPQEFLDEHGTGAEHIHQIKVSDLDGKPAWDTVTAEVAQELKGTVFIAQNASFEQNWLNHHLPNFTHRSGEAPVIDTLDISRRHFDIPNHQLKTICGQVGVPYTNGHRAVHDAEVTGAAFFKLRETLQKQWDSKPARKNAKPVTI